MQLSESEVRFEKAIQPLYPTANAPTETLQGLYLRLSLRQQLAKSTQDDILIYSNYITSLDGRISHLNAGDFQVPTSIANTRDWRLFQELAAQSDVILVSGRYIRQLADGKAQAPPPLSSATEHDDLHQWRDDHGLPAQPAIAVVSRSLDFPDSVLKQLLIEREVRVYTCGHAPKSRIEALQSNGIPVLCMTNRSTVDGKKLRANLIEAGHRMVYMAAGPQLHQTLLVAGVLDRLFLTQHHTLVGSDTFHTLISGELPASISMQLETLYYDQMGQQMFYQFSRGCKL
ncbi:MAG: dihydrofolate reductase family protein [Mariprofundaceae bacterium]